LKDIYAIDPFWHLTEAVSLQEAAALIAGYDPHQLALTVGENDVHPTYPKYYPVIPGIATGGCLGYAQGQRGMGV
jgi:hypothetical protein